MFCTNCGKEIEDQATFCVYCGTKMNDVAGGKGKGKMNKAVIAAVAAVIVVVAVFFVVKGLFGSGSSGLSEDDFVVGGQVTFGHYEQDNNYGNGKEPIVWDVLTVNEPGYMLVSHHILDCQPYDYGDTVGSFLDTHICQWLNTEFVSEAFSAEELACIQPMKPFGESEERTVQMLSMDQLSRLYSRNPDISYGTWPNTGETYYMSDVFVCGGTDYAIAQGLPRFSKREMGKEDAELPAEYDNRFARWFLIYNRDIPNPMYSIATQVHETGLAGSFGNSFSTPSGVRPVIWISKKAFQ
ncbi:MAG: zinc ribbon domain-containing protein [Lachnospiraceae bacterium]|nr:zinc ribbon domain-containing protein [Lachnospiraceae bacterium]